MSTTHQIELPAEAYDAIQALATEQQRPLQDVLEMAVRNGVSMARQHMFFEERIALSRDVPVEDVLAMLKGANNNAPDPGDELPKGYVRQT